MAAGDDAYKFDENAKDKENNALSSRKRERVTTILFVNTAFFTAYSFVR